jgi:hypothetical protein
MLKFIDIEHVMCNKPESEGIGIGPLMGWQRVEVIVDKAVYKLIFICVLSNGC